MLEIAASNDDLSGLAKFAASKQYSKYKFQQQAVDLFKIIGKKIFIFWIFKGQKYFVTKLRERDCYIF